MKSVIISSSQLTSACWHPIRFLRECKKCPKYRPEKHYQKCLLPEPEGLRAGKALLFDMKELLR